MLNSKNFINTILRQKSMVFSSILICAVISMVIFKYVPKSYKIQATLSVPSEYFRTPFISDFMAQSGDGAELRSQREALLRRALNHAYLLDVGKRHHLFGKLKDDEITTYDLDLLSKRFEIIPVGASSFLLGVFNNDPQNGYKLIQEVIVHLRKVLAEERHSTLLRLHDAIQDQLEVLSFGRHEVQGPSTIMASRPDLVKVEIDRIQAQLAVLRRSYSDRHPKIAELNKTLESLRKWLKQPSLEMTDSPMRAGVFSNAKVDGAGKDLFQDLLKKYHYLEVAIYLDSQSQETYLTVLQEPFVPKAAIWPKRPIFLIWGVLTGFILGTGFVLVSELTQARSTRMRGLKMASSA